MAGADRWDAAVAAIKAALDAGRLAEIAAAFMQAMAEFGIPDHPGGTCPPGACPCLAFEPLVVARVAALLGTRAGEPGTPARRPRGHADASKSTA
jgi:hypothetical protein